MREMKKIFNPENLVYLTVVLLPAYLIRFAILGIPTNALEMLILIIFICWLIKMDCGPISSLEQKKYAIPIGLILLGFILSASIGKNYSVGLGIIKSWFFFPLLLVFLISQLIEKDRLINVFKAFYLSAFLVAVASLGYLFSGRLTYDGRLAGFFNSPNYLAMYLAPAIIVLAQNAKRKTQNHSLKLKTFVYSSAIILLVALFFTHSYTAWAAIAISLLVVEITQKKQIKIDKRIWLTIFIILMFFLVQLKTTKFNDLVKYNSRSSLASRVMIWRSAGKILSDNWIWGIGPGNFQNKYLEYQKYYPPYLEWAVPHPHNLYLAFWLYGGILGFFGFISLLAVWFWEMLKKREDLLKFVALGVMLYILIHGLFDTTYFKNDLAIIFWLNFLALI